MMSFSAVDKGPARMAVDMPCQGLSSANNNRDYKNDYPYPRSLPFKKRRFLPVLGGGASEPSLTSALAHGLVSDQQQRPLELPPCVSSMESNDEQLAALALVAAAASSSSVPPLDTTSYCGGGQQFQRHGFSLQHQAMSSPLSSRPCADLTDVLCAAASFAAAELDEESDWNGLSASSGSTQRIYRSLPPSPLPNSCHGTTSRNNSCCRRLPCYHGSNYCKLHYQQYVAGALSEEAPSEEETASSIIYSGQQEQHANGVPTPPSKPATSKNGQAGHHQDKRFTGADDEERCTATTTRGRACAYVSVNGTKYCYLHADYDTNPPPRRGGTVAGGDVASANGPCSASSSPSTQEPSAWLDDSTPLSKERAILSAKRGASRNNMEKLITEAPYPLLSMLSTDQWFKKKVIISTGPMKDRWGRVEKWGNGWVTVRLSGGGLHNRRSFELYLHPSQQQGDAPDSTNNVVSEQQGVSQANNDNVPPASVVIKKVESNSSIAHEVTPCPSRHVIGIDTGATHDVSSRHVNNLMIPGIPISGPRPTQVPESPAPPKEESSNVSDGADLAAPDVRKKGEQKGSCDGMDPSDCNKDSSSSKGQVILKSPPPKFHLSARSSSRSEDDIPLVESLRLAQEGRLEKHKFALLFGTAALNRSRRKVVKPTKFEISPRSQEKKRALSSTSESDSKRKRLLNGPQLPSMISSGSEPGSGDSSVSSV